MGNHQKRTVVTVICMDAATWREFAFRVGFKIIKNKSQLQIY